MYLAFGSSYRGTAQSGTSDIFISLSDIRWYVLSNAEEDIIGKKVTVSGIANVSTGLFHERYMQIYIQNDSAGLSLYSSSFNKPVSPGDSMVARGEIQQYMGLTEVYVEDYKVYTENHRLPNPLEFQKVVGSPEKHEGMLVTGQGMVRAKGHHFNGKYLMIAPTDTSRQSVMVYVSNFHKQYEEFGFDKLSVGDHVKITGIISRYELNPPVSTDFKIFLRTPSDLEYKSVPKFYIWLFLAVAAACSLLILGWILMLKGQVDKQTDVIKTSLREKEVLLQEIHHRVKNNLAIISGLIELQLDSTSDEAALRVLKDSQVRIQSMAMVHEKLYNSATLSSVDMDVYIKDLVEAIHQTFISNRKNIEIDFRLEPIKLGIEQVISCGLLINELVVNAFKHAFREDKPGRLLVSFRKNNGEIELIVADNGPGLSEDFSPEQSESLGMMLIHTFASQLSAEMELERDNGTSFTFRFKSETAKRQS